MVPALVAAVAAGPAAGRPRRPAMFWPTPVSGVDSFNFERVFDEYTTWVGRDNTTGPSGRAVARASSVVDAQQSKDTVLIAWERLMQQDLVTAIETSGALLVQP